MKPSNMTADQARKLLRKRTKNSLLVLAQQHKLQSYSNLKKDELVDRLVAEPAVVSALREPNFLRKHFNELLGIVGLVLAIVPFVVAVNYGAWMEWISPGSTDARPLVVGIYPSDGFGPLRKAGLHQSLSGYPEVMVVDIDVATTQQLKEGDFVAVLARVRQEVAKENVLAIVGPSITECSRAVLAAIAAEGKRLPVFLECAGTRQAVGWDEFNDELAIFRLSSGVDRRAEEIARFVKDGVTRGMSIGMLVEQHFSDTQSSFGAHLHEEVDRHLRDWPRDRLPGSVHSTHFPALGIGEQTAALEAEVNSRDILLFLGLDDDFRTLADKFYRITDDAPAPRARLFSWVNAHALGEPPGDPPFRWQQIYEITDMNFLTSGPPPDLALRFRKSFGNPTPLVRDQAFSLDAGFCIMESYRQVSAEREVPKGRYPIVSSTFLADLETRLRSTLFSGITGDIRLGETGQNKDGRLIYCQYDTERDHWFPVNYEQALTPTAPAVEATAL